MAGRGRPNNCRVCHHESRAAIEQAILNAKPKSKIARDFGFTYTRRRDEKIIPDHKVISHHADVCMAGAYERAHADREKASGEAILTRLRSLDDQVDAVLDAARKGDPVVVGDVPLLNEDGTQVVRYDWRLVLAAVREGRANAELAAKLSGRLENDPQDPERIREALADPEARRLLAQLEETLAKGQTPIQAD